MNDITRELIAEYQVRKTNKQKIRFISWLRKKTGKMGYDITIDKYSDHGRNLIFGDLKNSDIILTAHYDTQANGIFPKISFMSNPFIYLLSEVMAYIVILGIFILLRYVLGKFIDNKIANTIVGVILIAYILQKFVGVANKHTVNDNTSGVATLLEIMDEIDQNLREKVTFVFFDHEELGFLGSQNFKDRYGKEIKEKPLINFDCVANGDYIFFITKKKFRKTRYNNVLENSITYNFKNEETKKAVLETSLKVIYTSDQILFNNSVAVTAMNKMPILGYYLDRIHSPLDTVYQDKNILLLKNTMIEFIKEI